MLGHLVSVVGHALGSEGLHGEEACVHQSRVEGAACSHIIEFEGRPPVGLELGFELTGIGDKVGEKDGDRDGVKKGMGYGSGIKQVKRSALWLPTTLANSR